MNINHPGARLYVSIMFIAGLSLGLLGLSTQAHAATKYNGNPLGNADYCDQTNGVTNIYGWAHDPQAAAGSSPKVVVKVAGKSDQTVSSSRAGYRDTAINAYLKAKGIPTSSVYGWKASYTGIYKGTNPIIGGTIINVGVGASSGLGVNANSAVDGDTTKAYFANFKIPDSCLPYRPATPLAHAALPAGPFKTAVPTVIMAADSDSNLTPWLQQYGIPIIKAWYPAVADKIAQPNYTPPTTITVRVSSAYNGVATTQNNTITLGSAWLAHNMNSGQGVLVHEMTHIVQSYSGPSPSWLTEGMADNIRYYMFGDGGVLQAPTSANHYTDSYSTSAYFLEYVARNYGPNFIHDLNVSQHNNTSTDNTDSYILARTGKSYATLWNEMMTKIVGPNKTVINGAGICLDVSGGNFTQGAKVQLWGCNGTNSQTWNWFTNVNAGTASVRINNNNQCLAVSGSGKGLGTPVLLANCIDGSTAQHWEGLGNNSLYNRSSNTCVAPLNNAVDYGTPLVTVTCNSASDVQRWAFY